MRTLFVATLATWILAAPAAAQLNTYYEGTQRGGGKSVPATTRFSVEKGRVAAVLTGMRSSRILYVEKEGVVRVIDDDSKSWFELDKKSMEQMSGGAFAQMKEKLASMPPEQRAMAEQMMQKMTGAATAPQPVTYVWSKETQKVKGYPCTRVDIMRGDEKRAEYWGTTSADFKMTEDERASVKAMHECLTSVAIMAQRGMGGGQPSAFQWDTSVDGYPLICRCFDGADTTLDVHLVRFDRKPIEEDLFKTPAGYKHQEIGGMAGKGHGAR